MVLLALESTALYEHLSDATEGNFVNGLIQQFFHYPWNGLRFRDLIQPAFMFIAGTAMAFSLHKQREQGYTWQQSFRKILKRCFLLFSWVHWTMQVRPKGLSFELWDVLTQLSFTTLVSFSHFQMEQYNTDHILCWSDVTYRILIPLYQYSGI
jgi:predicted acyltransferase